MERQYQMTAEGQQLLRQDLNLLGETSGLADDRVFAELLRMTPYDGSTVSRGILPATGTLVAGNGATGSVLVQPFRAFVGSRTAEATDARKNYRDIRSGLSVAEAATTRATTIAVAANASGNARWDLIYAIVTPDDPLTAVSRKVKDPWSKVVTSTATVTHKVTTVTLATAAGTPSATPEYPAVPADGGGAYNVPLAYLFVPNGSGSGTQYFPRSNIVIAAPIIDLSPAVGGRPIVIADTQYTMSTALQHGWGSGTPTHFVPPTVGVGGETLVVALDLTTGALSHANDSIVDSRDWRGRLCWYQAVALNLPFGWTTSAGIMPDPANGSQNHYNGWGQSNASGQERRLAQFTLVGGAVLTFYADATTGALKVKWTGTPATRVLIAMNFTRSF